MTALPPRQTQQALSRHERIAALERFKAEGRHPQWIFGWWRHEMHLAQVARDLGTANDGHPPNESIPPEDALRD
jgi:hypothetical protein